MKKKIGKTDVILIVCLILGIALLLYPSISNYVNSFSATRTIASYEGIVKRMDTSEIDEQMEKAREYNKEYPVILGAHPLEEQENLYMSLLNLSGNSVMGYIEIPNISIRLPIYHTTNESVLDVGVGHVEWSSLPVGGEGTHCVLSGHRGLPSAKLFTDIVALEEGDYFMLDVLNETLTYEVDQILIVLPEDIDALKAEEGKDYCTLVTCTPYGINTHRVLVRGHRIDNIANVVVVPDATRVNKNIVALFIGVPVLTVMWLFAVFKPRKGKKK